ncbi:peptidoglycan DD-metalloendopeptidase family protein [Candidatus Poribacteria bacterium]|nr:peptidoglycan DD-metalloendopeptidase family protein [Candidatus Poribacteria bacterium]
MYTLVFMSSRGNSVRQHTISKGHILLFAFTVSVLLLAGISGIGYGLFYKLHEAGAEKRLQVSLEENDKLIQAKLQVESELADVNEEMKDIRQMAEKIQQALGILGQGGGDNGVSWATEGSEAPADMQQENASATDGNLDYTNERQKLLTSSILKHEISSLYDYISEHQKQLDGYPSILPVKLQQENGEKYNYWYSSGFGWRIHPLTQKREFHQGLDIKTRSGVPIIAAADGTVVQVERDGYFGKTVEIDHEGNQFKTLYAHLKDYAEGLEVEQKVTRGQIIGYVGNTGRSTGAHLHYGVYDTAKEKWVNPIRYILDQQPTLSP